MDTVQDTLNDLKALFNNAPDLKVAIRKYIDENPQLYGEVITRPVDRRENYVKRCVGMPGQTLEIRNRIIYLDGKANKEPDNSDVCRRSERYCLPAER